MSLLIVTGISGAGKTLVCDTLEDIGYYCIDNLPPTLLLPVSRLNEASSLAVIIDSRSKDVYSDLPNELNKLKEKNIDFRLVFLDCDKDVILGRYKYTRRTHPLISSQVPSLQMAIDKEYELSNNIKNIADIVIDTTHFQPKQLKQVVVDYFKQTDMKTLMVKLMSFGYKNGIPAEADIVYDVRCTPNPYYIEELKQLSGCDFPVSDYVFSFPQSNKMLEMIKEFIVYSLPFYLEEGKNELVIAIGCTSGHHRSVAFVEKLKDSLKTIDYKIIAIHRDIDKAF